MPYAEHGVPYRVRNGRLNTAQHARVTGPRRLRGGAGQRHAVPEAAPKAQRRMGHPEAAKGGRGGSAGRTGAEAPSKHAQGAPKALFQSLPWGGSAQVLRSGGSARSRWLTAALAVVVVAALAFVALRLPTCATQPEATAPGSAPTSSRSAWAPTPPTRTPPPPTCPPSPTART